MSSVDNFILDEAEYLTDTEDDYDDITTNVANIWKDKIFTNLSRFMNTQFHKNEELRLHMIEIGYTGSLLTYYCDELDWQNMYILLEPQDKIVLKNNYTHYIQKRFPYFVFTD